MQYNETLVSLCRSLIRARSYSGQEQDAARVLSDFFYENGFHQVQTDRYGNIVGSIYGKRPGKALLFDGHMDTVPVIDADTWSYPPFEGVVENDRMFGRGTTDMKGALAAMACAAAEFLRATGGDFTGSVHVAGIVHEECFEGVAARLMSETVRPDYVVIGEASELNLKIGQRGRAEIKIETKGKAAHSANPHKGINAVYAMCDLISRLRKMDAPSCDGLGKGIMELVDIHSYPYPGASVVPELCVATFDRRLLTGETKESVMAPIEAVLAAMRAESPEFSARAYYATGEEMCYTGEKINGERFFPAWLFDEDESFIVSIRNRFTELGLNAGISQYQFCTNGSHYAGEAGIKTIGYGPSTETVAHTRDEYVPLADLETAMTGYRGIMEAILGEERNENA